MKEMTELGPNGMPPLFYKFYWNTVGQDVTAAFLSLCTKHGLPPFQH